jgi:hypothetical protein
MCSFNLFLSNFLFCDFNRVHSSEKKIERNFRCYVRLRVCRKKLLFAVDKVLIKNVDYSMMNKAFKYVLVG